MCSKYLHISNSDLSDMLRVRGTPIKAPKENDEFIIYKGRTFGRRHEMGMRWDRRSSQRNYADLTGFYFSICHFNGPCSTVICLMLRIRPTSTHFHFFVIIVSCNFNKLHEENKIYKTHLRS